MTTETKGENLINIRDFDEFERKEISHIIKNNVEMTILQRIFPFTENPIEKGEVFCICYRLINTSKNLVEKIETKNKLLNLLTGVEVIYVNLYKLYLREKHTNVFGKRRIHRNIIKILSNLETTKKINNLIDIFLILAQKFEFLDTDKIVAIDLDTKEGEQLVKEIFDENLE